MNAETAIKPGAERINWVDNPIHADWILEGRPAARSEHLSSSADGTASTYFWECTAGRFNWHYSFDETLYILDGAVTLKDPQGNVRRVVAGDTIFFPAGTSAEWHVEHYIRKLAYCRTPLPAALVRARNVLRRIRRWMPGAARGGQAAGMFPAA
jgi:uncharacterized cupin superfamily protein